MKIKINKGRHFEGDRLFSIETKCSEAFDLYKFLLLTNQLAFNEANKYQRALQKGLPLFFEDAVVKMIQLGKQGVDLMDDRNDNLFEDICNKWKLKKQKFKQTKIEVFENENI